MHLKTLITALALALPLSALPPSALAQDAASPEPAPEPKPQEQSPFVGRYDGSSMESAMRMIVREDGTFQWGLSVGSLDLRAAGTWAQRGGRIVFASDPKPIAPEFIWDAVETTQDGPFLRIEWAESGEPFSFADVRSLCANGELVTMPVMDGAWSPGDACDRPSKIELYLRSYQVVSGPFELVGTREVTDGQTIVFKFHRNDLGVADFDGVTGRLEGEELKMESSLGAMTLRKLAPPSD